MTPTATRPAPLTVAACAAAVVTAAGSLYLSLAMGLAACPLCYYQRTFALGAAGVLLAGLLLGGRAPLAALALPLAAAGLAVALWHVSLEARGRMECPGGLFDLGTAPQQSAAAFVLLTALLVIDVLATAELNRAAALACGVVLGAAFAAGCVHSASPPPPPKPEDYDHPPKTCRPLRKAQA